MLEEVLQAEAAVCFLIDHHRHAWVELRSAEFRRFRGESRAHSAPQGTGAGGDLPAAAAPRRPVRHHRRCCRELHGGRRAAEHPPSPFPQAATRAKEVLQGLDLWAAPKGHKVEWDQRVIGSPKAVSKGALQGLGLRPAQG